jgi:hypothetical protein
MPHSEVDPRVEHLRTLATDASFGDEFGLIRAMARCLPSAEAARLLLDEAGNSSRLRDALLRKVVEDLQDKCLREHRSLVRKLVASLQTADGRACQIVAFALSKIAEVSPKAMRHEIHQALLKSRYVGLRRRGYKLVGRDSSPNLDAVLTAWDEFRDPEGAWLLVKTLPANDLAARRGDLLPFLTEGWQLSRLFLRIAAQIPEALDELRFKDAISYCYVCAKLGRSIDAEVAKGVVAEYAGDERLGLLVWAFGQLRLWDVLTWMKDQMPELQEKRMAVLLGRTSLLSAT